MKRFKLKREKNITLIQKPNKDHKMRMKYKCKKKVKI